MAVYKLLSFVALMATFGHSQAQVNSAGSCPSDITVVSNFDVMRYLGTWYQYAKYPAVFEGPGVCTTAEYFLQADGNVGVTNTQINPITGEVDSISGYATVVSDGKLLVVFPVVPGTALSSNYWVLGTDYSSYSVVYSCQPLTSKLHSTFVWILTRERIPSATTINCAEKVLLRNNISLDPLVRTNQTGCH